MRRASRSDGATSVIVGALLLAGAVSWGGTAFGQAPPGHPPIPPGHPPVGSGAGVLPPVTEGQGSGKNALTWTAPRSWVKEKPSSSVRRAQYRVPGPGGDAECVVFYFGPGQGGDAKGNVDRWASQFKQPDGRPTSGVVKTRKLDVKGVPVLVAEITGTFVGGMVGGPPGPEQPNYMLLGAIAEGADASWFFKLTGPKATLESQRGAFEEMIKSLKRGA